MEPLKSDIGFVQDVLSSHCLRMGATVSLQHGFECQIHRLGYPGHHLLTGRSGKCHENQNALSEHFVHHCTRLVGTFGPSSAPACFLPCPRHLRLDCMHPTCHGVGVVIIARTNGHPWSGMTGCHAGLVTRVARLVHPQIIGPH